MESSHTMEKSKESNVNGKDEHLSALGTNVQKPLEKKKFCNTVFATKMRNRRKEEKLKEINTTEVLDSCKGKSIDVKHIDPKAVPKLIAAATTATTATEMTGAIQKHRKRKRWNRWKLGMDTKKKKSTLKNPKVNKVNNARVSDRSTSESNPVKTDSSTIKEEVEGNKLETSTVNGDMHRRKSLRHLAPNVIPNQKHVSEIKPDKETIPTTEIFSCRRIEPFIGKLKTRESRILNIEKLLNGPNLKNNNEPIANGNRNLPDKKEEKRTAFVPEINSTVKQSKSDENKESDNCMDAKSFTNKESSIKESKSYNNKESDDCKDAKSSTKRQKSENKHKNKLKNRSTIGIADTEKKLVDPESKNTPNKVNETKENEDEEISCRRTIPFEGKIIDKPASGITEISKNIACPNDVNIELDAVKENVNTEHSCSSMDSNSKQNSSDVIHKKSKASNNMKAKSDSNLTSGDVKLKSSKDINMSNEKSKNESYQVQNDSETDSSIKDANALLHVLNKTNTIFDKTAKDQSIEVNEEDSFVQVKDLSNSSSETNTKINVLNNASMELDKLPESVESQRSDSEHGNWSCSRTEPYKYYFHCSRTLPYVRPVNKAKTAVTSGASSDQVNHNNQQPESISNHKLTLNETEKSNSETNIPRNSESESVDCMVDTNLGSNSETVQNGEWKFRRKRQKTFIEQENKIEEETHPLKKSKIKSSPSVKASVDRKLTATPVSPSRTICSLLSLNCTKHDHHHHTDNGMSVKDLAEKQKACVALLRLEHINDPLVVDYLKKTDLLSRIDSSLMMPEKDINEKPSTSLNDAKLIVSNEKVEEVARDVSASLSLPTPSMLVANATTTITSNTIKASGSANQPTEVNSSIDEKVLRPKSRARVRPLSRVSTESPSITRNKRNKHPVNYLEAFSESDEDIKSNFSISLRTRSQSRGPTLRERNKHKVGQEMDDNDMEVEEFSHIGRNTKAQSRMAHESNHNILNKEEINDSINIRTRSLSRAAKAIESPNKKVQSLVTLDSDKNEQLTVHHSELSAKLSSIHNKLNQENLALLNLQQEDAELDKEIEEHSRNYKQLRTQSPDLDAELLNSPSSANLDQLVGSSKSDVTEVEEQCRVSDLRTPSIVQSGDKQLATPKSTNGIPVSGRISRASKRGESASRTLRDISTTPSRGRRESSCSGSRSSTPRKTRRLSSNLPTKISRSRLNSEAASLDVKPAIEIAPSQDLKVQLIKIETVCQSFKDYSASEIEVLTRKYIDLLMNSNFTCDTWREPINYHRPVDTTLKHQQQVEQVDNSDCVSTDFETQCEDIEEPMSMKEIEKLAGTSNEEFTIIEERIVIEKQQETSPKIQKQKTPDKPKKASSKKIDQQNVASLTPLESAIATLANQVEPLEKMDLGVLNTSVPDKETRNEQIIASPNVSEASRVNQEQTELVGKDVSKNRDKNTITVNGTTMHTCPSCNKIFVIEDLLKEHITLIHGDKLSGTDSNVTSTTKTKTNEKRTSLATSGPSSAKKQSGKIKKKHRYSESLKCAICSQMFETKELLFEHIMTHNETELQSAYVSAIAIRNHDPDPNIMDEVAADLDASHQKKDNNNRKKSTDGSIKCSMASFDGEDSNDNESRATSTMVTANAPVEQQQQVIDLAGNDNNSEIEPILENICQRPISICPCHAHETTNQDLQIEMVLLCKTCNVIFRRRDCFEVHYRSSPECRLKRSNNEITKVPKLFCSGCPCVLESLTKMREHLEEHAKKNNQGTVTFICNICKVAFFGVGGIFYSHWFNHTKAPNFVASRYSFPKLSVVTVLEDPNVAITTTKSQEGFFYIAEHVCRQCRLPFSSEPELQKHKEHPCQPPAPAMARSDGSDSNRLQMIKLICDLCKKYYVNKENFDRHCCERNHLKTPPPKFSRLPINNNEQAFVCGLCRSVAKTDEEMKEHWKRIHSPIMELYTCKTCNIVPSNDVTNYTYEKFERHCRLMHKSEVITCLVYFVTARYVCNVCKFGFESERSMKEHQVIHQKRSTATNIAAAQTPVPAVLPMNPSAPSFWVTNQSGPDGSMQMHSIYVQYPNINGNIHPQVPILPNAVPVNVMNPQQMQIQNTLIHAGTLNVTPSIITSDNVVTGENSATTSASNTAGDSVLRTILVQPAVDHRQSCTNEPGSTSRNSIIETIQIDSRSNSPILDNVASTTTVTVTTNSGTSVTADETVPTSPTSRKKSYMTMVNPNFESMLGTNNSSQSNVINDASPAPDKGTSSSSGDVTPVSTESATPQPFEVVLLTDDLSENSNGETNPANDQPADQRQKTMESTENSSVKPFLRVRSIAELQKMKIHLCSVCGLSFDTPSAFEIHSQQHEASDEVGRATPVQMISPMISQANKETSSEPHNILITQMRQKLSSLSTNGPSSPNNSDSRTNISPTVHPSQPRLQQQQQQQQNYWFAPCNGAGINVASSITNNYSINQQQQRSQHQNIPTRSMNSPVNTIDSYLTPRGLPPPYPGTTNTMIPSRPGTIQLPERNLTDSSTPGTKRPSGAATRIPQQSLPSFQELAEHRQSNTRAPYNCNSNDGSVQNSSLNNRAQMNASAIRNPHTVHHILAQKTYSRSSNEMNYSTATVNNPESFQSPGQQRKNIYNCQYFGCNFRSQSLAALRAHGAGHLSTKQSSTSPANQESQSNLSPQQRLPSFQNVSKHVLVNQVPERTRHAVPSSRLAPTNSTEKRLVCRICNFTCTTSTELIQHVTTNHSAPAPNQVCCYVCDYCPTPLIFESEDLLRKHMNSSHNHFCNVCNKRYPSKEDLMMHMDVHARTT
ncbi:uncharacterized protein LOC100678834 isoform X1 [Nasonia vitripennis]|uniref:C2H2-type domain-containing protein n=1 Tax=Nasonia vitripennis TaxID=7425 RepID=A0A7M7Q7G9_NASVI|nr:uncharacterized protein LOC100678834 isoform X1 [Nasonia vitripennis]XP_031783166.1 uncharacterized protein LOC100678834 isoform X1 [Nasonia vitripennis]XP_032454391.1 uncharacterized protein LOC100678834 isoform X1 [Nasonia vitripennis]